VRARVGEDGDTDGLHLFPVVRLFFSLLFSSSGISFKATKVMPHSEHRKSESEGREPGGGLAGELVLWVSITEEKKRLTKPWGGCMHERGEGNSVREGKDE